MPVQEIKLDAIHNNPYQKRHHYNDIPDLARTIATDGLQQIPKARSNGAGVQLKFGHRRCQAFRWLAENWKKEGLPERYQGYTVMPLDIEDLSDEQMFRGATIENHQRKDLSPIERMEEMKAWVEFGYTSKQIAEMYPGMSDATVRGLLYFDKLTPEAKEALHQGEITQGTARAVLSLQRVAPPQIVIEALKEIKEEEQDAVNTRWGGKRLPEEVVKDKLEEQRNVKSLWYDMRGGKPRACSNDGWALDMKNFPNKLLPKLTVEEAMEASLDGQDGEFKKRVAAYLENGSTAGMTESDIQFIEHLTNPPACTACPFYTKLGSEHYCGMNVCYSRKERAWARQKLHNASKTLGIALYDPEADGDLLIFEDKWHNEQHAKLFNAKGKDLRLAFMEDADRKRAQGGYEGVPSGAVVGVVGETLKKLLKEKVEKREAKKEDTSAVVEEMKEEKAEALLAEAALYVQTLFGNFNDTAMKSLAEAPNYGWGSDDTPFDEPKAGASDKEWAGFLRREYAFRMLDRCDDIPDTYDVKSLREYADAIVKAVKGWGVKVPAAFLKTADGFDAELAAVAAETKAQAKAGKGKSK